jgi:hypothetical protein
MQRWLWLSVFLWSTALAQTGPIGPGKPGQKKLPPKPSSQPTSQEVKPIQEPATPIEPPKKEPIVLTPTPIEISKPTSSPTPNPQAGNKVKKAPQGWLRIAGGSSQFRPEAIGGAVDVFLLRQVLRLGMRAEQWRFEGLVGPESLTLGAGVLGLAYPARVTPFVEVYAGGGLWHQTLFNQEIYDKTRTLGIAVGAEVYVSSMFFLFASGGYEEASRVVETFEGPAQETFGGSSFRLGLGLVKK